MVYEYPSNINDCLIQTIQLAYVIALREIFRQLISVTARATQNGHNRWLNLLQKCYNIRCKYLTMFYYHQAYEFKSYKSILYFKCILCGKKKSHLKEEKYCHECHAKKCCSSGDWTIIEKGLIENTYCHECCRPLNNNDDYIHRGYQTQTYHGTCWRMIKAFKKQSKGRMTDIKRNNGIET